jgi:hypothetical protein
VCVFFGICIRACILCTCLHVCVCVCVSVCMSMCAYVYIMMTTLMRMKNSGNHFESENQEKKIRLVCILLICIHGVYTHTYIHMCKAVLQALNLFNPTLKSFELYIHKSFEIHTYTHTHTHTHTHTCMHTYIHTHMLSRFTSIQPLRLHPRKL